MSEHKASITWAFSGGDFLKGRYSREHTWAFDGGVKIPASPSPSVVPAPYSNPAGVDPEEAFVAAIASCHMLTFLYLAGREGIEVTSYEDDAVGVMTKNENRVPWVSSVLLTPRVTYGADKAPSPEQERHLHEAAHHGCFISNSVKTEITVKLPDERQP
jgi:organic hydroperoxide reductase OsmC/OhrA